MNRIIRRGNKVNRNISDSFIHNNCIIKGDLNIGNAINEYFVNIGQNLGAKIKKKTSISHRQFMNINSTGTVFLKPVIENEVLTIVKKFKGKMSTSYDEVKMKTVKSIIHSIVVPLTHIFNRSISTGIFPKRLKLAKVIPIFKSGNRKEFSNYRPVSILPQFSKKSYSIID